MAQPDRIAYQEQLLAIRLEHAQKRIAELEKENSFLRKANENLERQVKQLKG